MANNSRPPFTGYPAPPPGSGYPPGAHSNTGYPYTPPRPQYANYQYFALDWCPTFLRYFLVAMIAFFAIVGTMLCIVWLVLRPLLPEFRVESVTLANFSVSYSSQHISGDWLIRFQVANPNKKMRISYADIESYIYYESEPLSPMRLPPFDQGTGNQTVVQASFAAVDSYVDGWAVSGMNAERASGAVSFQVRLIALARFGAAWWPARWRLIRVFCDDLAVALPPNNGTGKLTGGVRDCRVGL